MRLILISIFVTLQFISVAQPIDSDASQRTVNLYNNLKKTSQTGIMFGHQDDLVYGTDWWAEKGKSDVKIVTGDYPAVYGFDLGKIHQNRNLDSVAFEDIKDAILLAYKNKGIVTLSWHIDNPLTGGSSWDKSETIKHILPGGKAHGAYVEKLDLLAVFMNSCKTSLGTQIPLIFRPFHEHNGDWFWWGKPYATEDEYIALWRFTVDYLKNDKSIHHLLYAYSPDRSRMEISKESYLFGYPGDDYVDIVGLDNYWDAGHPSNTATVEEQKNNFTKSIALIDGVAKEKGKIAALTETGKAKLETNNWFSERVLEPTLEAKDAHVAWVLVWRNESKNYFYVPYKGHKNENDFISFKNHTSTLFQSDIDNPYKK